MYVSGSDMVALLLHQNEADRPGICPSSTFAYVLFCMYIRMYNTLLHVKEGYLFLGAHDVFDTLYTVEFTRYWYST
jgi:hypothetical protein